MTVAVGGVKDGKPALGGGGNMKRRNFIASSAATLAMPAVGHAQSVRVFKWIPESDLAVLDPVWTPAYPARGRGYIVFDTLYGQAGPRGG
jgi:peptide/nickel transport system substrate-binding protein